MPVTRSLNTFFVQATVSTVAKSLIGVGFTAAQVAIADRVIISVDTGALRVIWDTAPTAPTTTKGIYIPNKNNPYFVLEGRTNAALLQMIRDGGSDATVNIMIESD